MPTRSVLHCATRGSRRTCRRNPYNQVLPTPSGRAWPTTARARNQHEHRSTASEPAGRRRRSASPPSTARATGRGDLSVQETVGGGSLVRTVSQGRCYEDAEADLEV